MAIVGMLHHRKHPKEVKKAYACAAVAKMMGVEFFYFSPHNVKLNENLIHGFVFENGNWIQKVLPFPDVIYNSASMRSATQKNIYRQLKKNIPFTSHPIGNKMQVFRKIRQIEEFSNYLIPSKKVRTVQTVLNTLIENKKVVVKPISGHRGEKVIFIEQKGEQFEVIEGCNNVLLSEAEFKSYVLATMTEKPLLVQPYIECKTIDGNPFDFRIHVQKNGVGRWEITLIYPRIGSKTGIISNVSKGGYIGKLESFLEREYGAEGYDIQKTLEQFAIRFSKKFDELYNQSLDELGIDVGIDQSKKLWIFEVNWRPGYVYRELDAALRLIPYAVYIARKHKRES